MTYIIKVKTNRDMYVWQFDEGWGLVERREHATLYNRFNGYCMYQQTVDNYKRTDTIPSPVIVTLESNN